MWEGTFQASVCANNLDSTKEADRCRGILLSSLGLPIFTLLSNLLAPAKPTDKSLLELIVILKVYFKPAPKGISERFRFMGRKQNQGETVSQFLAELRHLATHCKFKDLDERLRDQFVFGLLSESATKPIHKG